MWRSIVAGFVGAKAARGRWSNLRGVLAITISLSLVTGFLQVDAPTASALVPSNDDWTDAPTLSLSSFPFTASVNTTDATLQAGEPQPCGSSGNTVWYAFTTVTGERFAIDTIGSDFDTVLAVYVEGSNPWPNELVGGCNDDAGASTTSEIQLDTSDALTYYVQVGGKAGASGNLVLNIGYSPQYTTPADDWADAIPLNALASDLAVTVSGDTSAADLQPGEPQPCGNVGNTVWYQFVPIGIGAAGGSHIVWSYDIDTAGSDFDTVLSLYVESSESWPNVVECNDDDGALVTSAMHLDFTSNDSNTYWLQVGGNDGASGNLVLNMSPAPAPPNDELADAQLIEAVVLPLSDAQLTRGATVQGGFEAPINYRCGSIARDIWYAYTPEGDTEVVVDTLGSDFDTGLIVAYPGSGSRLAELVCNDDDGALLTSSLSLSLAAHTTYYFLVGATYDYLRPAFWSYGCLVFNIRDASQAPAPQTNCELADTTPPAIAFATGGPSHTAGSDTFVTSASTITVSVADDSALGSCTITITGPAGTTGVPCAQGDTELNLSGPDGSYTLTVEATDEHGNPSSSSATYILDNSAPTLSPSVAPDPVLQGSSAVASANASDGAGSGLAASGCDPVDTSVLGPQSVSCFATDNLGHTAYGSASYLVYAYAPGGGAFVIGDQSTSGTVTFWGSQWAKANALSGGAAPAAFKGFARSPGAPACGTSWSTAPGNSPPPPAGPLPEYMALIVTSSAAKAGSAIAGNTVQVVVVKTNPGYSTNPGHAGTGTVVATLCE